MKKRYTIKNFYNSSILNSWFNNAVLLFSSLIAIPIVITKLSTEEINIWFLLASITALSQSVLFGFNLTFSRFVSYSFSGVTIDEFRTMRHKKELNYNKNINIKEFISIYYLMKKVYFFLAFCFLVMLLVVGYLFLQKPIGFLENPIDGWIAASIVAFSSTITLYLGYNQNFLYGIHKVALINRIQGLVNLIGLILILYVLFFIPSLINIILVYKSIALLSIFVIFIFANKEFNSIIKTTNIKYIFDKNLFLIVWENTWKSGTTSILANIIRHMSALIVSQLFTVSTSAMFLFTKQIFDIIEHFTTTTFYAKVPYLTTLRSRGNLIDFNTSLLKIQYISYGVFFIGYIGLIIFGDTILSMIKSNVQLGNVELIILFSYASFFARWAGLTSMISNMANHVVDYKLFLIIIVVYFILIFSLYEIIGIEIFPIATILGFIVGAPILIKYVYSTFDTTFIKYEKKVSIPLLALLTLINIAYYNWSN